MSDRVLNMSLKLKTRYFQIFFTAASAIIRSRKNNPANFRREGARVHIPRAYDGAFQTKNIYHVFNCSSVNNGFSVDTRISTSVAVA